MLKAIKDINGLCITVKHRAYTRGRLILRPCGPSQFQPGDQVEVSYVFDEPLMKRLESFGRVEHWQWSRE